VERGGLAVTYHKGYREINGLSCPPPSHGSEVTRKVAVFLVVVVLGILIAYAEVLIK
jgi:hypothetical protein